MALNVENCNLQLLIAAVANVTDNELEIVHVA